ncbi:carboxylate--amine ligase [Agaricicola taiwanensis]|uniref:Carboxylate--amine ligase n=1 Tax=Agaricicola taiwanensis TaxID=591372 RepID=A0A8J3E058_9RHOB|nr:RimK family protein [Agaricicola taiwanensis]GGE53410.1 carboxylate--amine ligase [Agaricicola taiwanensis]
MTGWVILVDNAKDFPNADTPHKVITTREYLARPRLFDAAAGRPKLINLSRSYAYQSRGYYASLLAEARGHRIIPTVETMLELRTRTLYEPAIPEIEDALNRCAKKLDKQPEAPFSLLVCFGRAQDPHYEGFARVLFDWFRCPVLEVSVEPGPWLAIDKIRPRALTKLDETDTAFLHEALEKSTRREWRGPKQRVVAKYSLAVLHDPKEAMPPSNLATLKHFARLAEKQSVEVNPITKKNLHNLAEYDGLFIRETTSIDNHTYRFARRAVHEGMPVIDDPVSMIRCTNKVYLMELLGAAGVHMPPTLILSEGDDVTKAIDLLGLPLVVKIPDGSFSRGIHKVKTEAELKKLCADMFEDTDLLLAQKFMPTAYDWRVGVLGGEPLFACQYMMAKNHWQIIKHDSNGSALEGGFKTFDLDKAPPEVVTLGMRAARPIGQGLYGVDIKETDEGLYVMEVNDNPNLEHGVEDAVLKDELWNRITRWFIDRMEKRQG